MLIQISGFLIIDNLLIQVIGSLFLYCEFAIKANEGFTDQQLKESIEIFDLVLLDSLFRDHQLGGDGEFPLAVEVNLALHRAEIMDEIQHWRGAGDSPQSVGVIDVF